ncbi:hypothetical protein F5144DRAFT_298577 [Chaetomium tenue]|uniref:Uncharacterized protein n=1 Tax=Chaetomium tenue TaxID=1854479 RepID=A0ACB7P791_9PEZI|nr:hypothetical protein F5144DRAFT_298577 [Chaetomium globosum]
MNFPESGPIFNGQERAQAVDKFRRIITYFENTEQPASSQYGRGYSRPALVRHTFEYARSPESQDKFLKAFFQSLALGMLDDNADGIDLRNDDEIASLRELLFSFADHLIYHFFLPFRASAGRTPQPTPTYHLAVQQVQTQEEQQRMQELVGTPERLGALRGLCLTRDRHRCVITRAFDQEELLTERLRQPPARDDDGNVLNPQDDYSHLEVAHLIPFGLTKSEGGDKLSEPKKATMAILNMFDVGIIHLIEGKDIDGPRNAITLSLEMRRLFGKFDIFFERVAGAAANTYQIQAFHPFLTAQLQFPVYRTLFSHPYIDPPLARLLELHSAIGHILHLSDAGDYLNVILRDMEDGAMVREDGSTQLGALVNVALQIHT